MCRAYGARGFFGVWVPAVPGWTRLCWPAGWFGGGLCFLVALRRGNFCGAGVVSKAAAEPPHFTLGWASVRVGTLRDEARCARRASRAGPGVAGQEGDP